METQRRSHRITVCGLWEAAEQRGCSQLCVSFCCLFYCSASAAVLDNTSEQAVFPIDMPAMGSLHCVSGPQSSCWSSGNALSCVITHSLLQARGQLKEVCVCVCGWGQAVNSTMKQAIQIVFERKCDSPLAQEFLEKENILKISRAQCAGAPLFIHGRTDACTHNNNSFGKYNNHNLCYLYKEWITTKIQLLKVMKSNILPGTKLPIFIEDKGGCLKYWTQWGWKHS